MAFGYPGAGVAIDGSFGSSSYLGLRHGPAPCAHLIIPLIAPWAL